MIYLKNIVVASDTKVQGAHNQLPRLQIDVTVDTAEKVAVVGKSGAGKSTLLNVIAGFVDVTAGQVFLNGVEHTHSKPYERPISMLFQEHNLFHHLTVYQNMALGICPQLKLTSQQKQAVEEVAEQVGLADLLDRQPNQLSGGQRQRVALARCLLRDKPILLLDEPFSALDKGLREEMLFLVKDICQQKQITLLLVTHQPEELKGFVDRELRLEAGSV